MVVAVEVTPYHKTQLVELFIGGLDSSSGGQDSDRSQALLVLEEAAIEDARDVSLHNKNK
jgi:hypothetical protein